MSPRPAPRSDAAKSLQSVCVSASRAERAFPNRATFAGFVSLFAASALLTGCPIYAGNSCSEDPSCNGPTPVPGHYYDPDGGSDGGYDAGPETASGCGTACASGYTCTNVGGSTYQCIAYDCRAAERACSGGQQCLEVTTGAFACTTPAPLDCQKTGCVPGLTCVASKLDGSHQCANPAPDACAADADCPSKKGAGSLCLGGVCTAQKDLCSDATQCTTGACVEGRCIGKCASTCSVGYTCDAKGLCTGGTGACDGAAGKVCAAATACVGSRCVPPAAVDGSCPTGLVWAGGGCVANDRPVFFCDTAGTADGKQDACAAGSICLHHNCYITCDPTAAGACATAGDFNVCKSVTTSSGAHHVCGSASNLGTECDPTSTSSTACSAGKTCIDGFCK
jgi:hypothetical protein